MTTESIEHTAEPPQRLRAEPMATRYGITQRLASEWIRRMVADGVAARVGKYPVGRLSACDAWVAAGGQRRVRGVRP